MYPYSPQLPPQEFLIIQFPDPSYPTNNTPWSKVFPQLLKTPPLYADQVWASTPTDIGYSATAAYKDVHVLGTSLYPEILKAPVLVLQV